MLDIETIDGPALYARVDLERLRRQRGSRLAGPGFPYYTWQRVGREIGVSVNTLLSWKRDRQQPSASTVKRVLAWLGEEIQ